MTLKSLMSTFAGLNAAVRMTRAQRASVEAPVERIGNAASLE